MDLDLEAFRALARQESCGDVANRLRLIDGQLVLWDRSGSCVDAAYAITLFGHTADNSLCDFRDSIAGPRKICRDESRRQQFETILAHLDDPDLGLGPGHTIESISF